MSRLHVSMFMVVLPFHSQASEREHRVDNDRARSQFRSVSARSSTEANLANDFAIVFERSFEPMTRFASALTGSRSVGEDVAQEAFTRLFAALRKGTRVDASGAYLRRTIVNIATDAWRRRGVVDRADALFRVDLESSFANDTPLLDALERLTERQRAAVVLRFYLQCNEAEIADALHCRKGTVKSLLARALGALRTELSEELS